MVVIGEKFPEVEVKTTHGVIKLPDYFAEKGKWFILFSHPADFTPVCTTEFYAMQKRAEEFRKLGVEPIGLSVDQVFSHLKWMEWIKENLGEEITFPVIADDRGDLAEALGMIPSGATITARAVFVVDDKGVIRAIVYYPAEVGRDWDEILRLVKALKTSDEKGVALPHKWPNNELIGDRAIVPPAASVEEIKAREEAKAKGEIECYDWWFCHKKI
ncbi:MULTISPECIES: peroxiredoxin [Thermococcus]|uniref:Peroxiredoxin n=1 Tax=Thermococcus barossii TaxID=54077 RepID=A0A2Z2MGD9_9EURY|nr:MULTISPECIES: peroxiredoxin [Thermococcus]ASJ04733.1 peroxiredoxin [Thermococcus barossii]NJE76133.1 peroxiredoxin [Thermococcus sp. ES12]